MESLSKQQAIDNLGIALANESLKLSQKEHLILIDSFNIIKEIVAKSISDDLPKEQVEIIEE